MRTIDWWDGAVRIIDQTRLPQAEIFIDVRDVDELVVHIQSLAVRGAMALGVAGALGMALAATTAARAGDDVDRALDVAAEKLSNARPTAVNLGYGVRAVQRARAEGADVAGVLAAALAIRDEDILANRAIGEAGAAFLHGARRILTHCNAGALAGVEEGTALGVIGHLHRESPLTVVYVCETRPLLQGSRLTAWELSRAGILYRSSRTRIGRSRSVHARSAVRTSGGVLRNVRARQQRSPNDNTRPPAKDRMAPANSASISSTGSIVTPAAASNSRTRLTSRSASTSLPMTSARFAAPKVAELSSAATSSAPGSS